jgi:hypothetical protein
MSSHFTYEIDERKLRNRLKDLEVPFDTEAWHSFESYTATQVRNNSSQGLKDMQITLNRNVIVPVVFGALIVFFSFLLFNFINIKKPAENASQATPEIVIPSAEVKTDLNPVIPVGASENVPVGNSNNTDGIKETEPTLKEVKVTPVNNPLPSTTKEPTTKPVQPPAQQLANKPSIPANSQPVNQGAPAQTLSANPVAAAPATTVAAAQVAATTGAKKKQKRRNVEIVDTDSSGSARPAVGGEEREGADRPN